MLLLPNEACHKANHDLSMLNQSMGRVTEAVKLREQQLANLFSEVEALRKAFTQEARDTDLETRQIHCWGQVEAYEQVLSLLRRMGVNP